MKVKKKVSKTMGETVILEHTALEKRVSEEFLESLQKVLSDGETLVPDSYRLSIPTQGALWGHKKLLLNVSFSTNTRIVTVGIGMENTNEPGISLSSSAPSWSKWGHNGRPRNWGDNRIVGIKVTTYLLGERSTEYSITPDEDALNGLEIEVYFPRLNFVSSVCNVSIDTPAKEGESVVLHDFRMLLPDLLNLINAQMAVVSATELTRELIASSMEEL